MKPSADDITIPTVANELMLAGLAIREAVARMGTFDDQLCALAHRVIAGEVLSTASMVMMLRAQADALHGAAASLHDACHRIILATAPKVPR